jgi:hypothetical protein
VARFTRTSPAPTVTGDYGAFRSYVRQDFEQCCAYCYLHERHAGGETNFELDHFCPKDKFPHLRRTFTNLYWSCSVCNGFKGKSNHWPSDELIAQGKCFVDLCKDDFETHYNILDDGTLEALTPSAEYTIDKIRLNSEHLIKIRYRLLKEGKELDKEPA